MKIILLVTLMINFSYGELFGDTEEERMEFKQKIIKDTGTSILNAFVGAGKLLISPVTGAIRDAEREKRAKAKAEERRDAKSDLFKQMNPDTNETNKSKDGNGSIRLCQH